MQKQVRGEKAGFSAGQLLLVGFRPDEEKKILSLVEQGRLGGVILFSRNGEDARDVIRLCSAIRHVVKGEDSYTLPFVAVDQEQGRVCRILDGVTRFPGAAALGELDRSSTTERVAHWVGREMAALGVHLNLAPVADVLQKDMHSQVLADRAFGHDPNRVARHVRAWIRGSQGAKVAACAKHFPGHGSVGADSHLKLPRDVTPMEKMERLHLKPFVSAIRAGVAAVMVGHVAYDALDPGVPASLSTRVIQGLLREGLGFDGLVLTDDLDMRAVRESGNPVEVAVQAIAAGADMALVGRNMKAVVDVEDLIKGIEEAVRRETLPMDRVQASMNRVFAFKRQWIPYYWAPPSHPPPFLSAQRLSSRLWAGG